MTQINKSPKYQIYEKLQKTLEGGYDCSIIFLIGMYQIDEENSKEYYDIIMNYLFYNENELFTFDCNDERLQGSGLACLQEATLRSLFDDVVEYDTDLYLNDNVFATSRTNVENIVNDHSNQMSR